MGSIAPLKHTHTHTLPCYLHDWENLWEDDAGFSQVLIKNPLVELVGGVFDLCGLKTKSCNYHFYVDWSELV